VTQTGFDVAIVGAGIVGLATAMELLDRRPGTKLVVLDKEDRVAAHQTGHNSGVIHAGLYYKPGSLKAQMSVEGARLMIEFCQEHGLPYELCGKVVVATSERELPRLEELYRRGAANGVPGLRRISAEEVRELEPHAAGIAGLYSPRTGIVDYKAVAQAYARIVEGAGAEIHLRTRVTAIEARPGELLVKATGGEILCRNLINCAGLQSDSVARMTGSRGGPRIVPFRGEYYELAPRSRELIRGLLYPVPDPTFPFLGVHFTKKITGSVEAGPNAVLAFAREGYRKLDLNLSYLLGLVTYPGFWIMTSHYWRTGLAEFYRSWSRRAFAKALQRLLPELDEDDLKPGGAGVRAQALDASGKLLDDFSILEGPNTIHVLNAPSPAATVSLAIGRQLADRALTSFGLDA
jgi:L-2-hydroxyglutarate oxidase LhgO